MSLPTRFTMETIIFFLTVSSYRRKYKDVLGLLSVFPLSLHSSHSFYAHKELLLCKNLILHSLLRLLDFFIFGYKKKSCQMGSSACVNETEQKPLSEYGVKQQIVTSHLQIT